MKIKREIFGRMVEIALTGEELYEAYTEQEHLYDLDDCRDDFMLRYEEEPWYSSVYHDDEAMENILEQMAAIYRRNMNKYNMSHDHAMDDAATDEEVMKLIEKFRDDHDATEDV